MSTWLAAGVPSTQCAEWAGHSVAVLHEIYAKVIAGLESTAHDRIDAALRAGGRWLILRGRYGGDCSPTVGGDRT